MIRFALHHNARCWSGGRKMSIAVHHTAHSVYRERTDFAAKTHSILFNTWHPCSLWLPSYFCSQWGP